MALEICATAEKKIIISGTTVEIPSVYNRLEFAAMIDGISIEIGNHIFQNKDFFDQRIGINTNIPVENIYAKIDVDAGEQQSLESCENYAKIAYESLGYIVNIIGKNETK
jgi:hypothetical protein